MSKTMSQLTNLCISFVNFIPPCNSFHLHEWVRDDKEIKQQQQRRLGCGGKIMTMREWDRESNRETKSE